MAGRTAEYQGKVRDGVERGPAPAGAARTEEPSLTLIDDGHIGRPLFTHRVFGSSIDADEHREPIATGVYFREKQAHALSVGSPHTVAKQLGSGPVGRQIERSKKAYPEEAIWLQRAGPSCSRPWRSRVPGWGWKCLHQCHGPNEQNTRRTDKAGGAAHRSAERWGADIAVYPNDFRPREAKCDLALSPQGDQPVPSSARADLGTLPCGPAGTSARASLLRLSEARRS